MKVLSLFDGISCGMVALERVGIKVDRYVAYEIDKYAIKISNKNYPIIEHCGDVQTADFTKYNGFDLLIGGSPCTYWSIAKKGREVTPDGVGGQLFMQYVRALHESYCKYFLYENNYSIHKNIREFISKELGVQPIMIDSALFSAQSRKRLYWTNIPVNKLPEFSDEYVSNILETDGIQINEHDYSKRLAIKAQYNNTSVANMCRQDGFGVVGRAIRIGNVGSNSQGWRVYSVHGKSITLAANGGGMGSKTGLYKIDLPDGDYVVRKLTPVEAERLQTLPDGYTEGISSTQRYKCIGNGWTVDVISHILKGIVQA